MVLKESVFGFCDGVMYDICHFLFRLSLFGNAASWQKIVFSDNAFLYKQFLLTIYYNLVYISTKAKGPLFLKLQQNHIFTLSRTFYARSTNC